MEGAQQSSRFFGGPRPEKARPACNYGYAEHAQSTYLMPLDVTCRRIGAHDFQKNFLKIPASVLLGQWHEP